MNEAAILLLGFVGGFVTAVLAFGSFKPRR